MVTNIFAQPIFTEFILPFLLVFTVLFAILDKTKILGDGKRQINAIVALIVGLMIISFANFADVIFELFVFLAVGIVVIFVFLILWGFVFAGEKEFKMNKGLKVAFGILIGIGLIGALLFATDSWDYVYNNVILGEGASSIWTTVLFLGLIGGALAIVLGSKDKDE